MNYPWLKQRVSMVQRHLSHWSLNTVVLSSQKYFSYFSTKNINCEYSLKTPEWGTSNMNPQCIFHSSWQNAFFKSISIDIFLISPRKHIYCRYSLEAPHWGASNEYLHICSIHNIRFLGDIRKIFARYLLLLIVLGFNDTSTLVGHFVSSPKEKDKRDSRRDEREGQEERRTGVKVKK